MNGTHSLSHTKWNCKYLSVWQPWERLLGVAGRLGFCPVDEKPPVLPGDLYWGRCEQPIAQSERVWYNRNRPDNSSGYGRKTCSLLL